MGKRGNVTVTRFTLDKWQSESAGRRGSRHWKAPPRPHGTCGGPPGRYKHTRRAWCRTLTYEGRLEHSFPEYRTTHTEHLGNSTPLQATDGGQGWPSAATHILRWARKGVGHFTTRTHKNIHGHTGVKTARHRRPSAVGLTVRVRRE